MLTIDAARPLHAAISPLLFGLGVDLPAQTYHQAGDTSCAALAGAGAAVTLVRIGAATADDYDWRGDTYDDQIDPRKHIPASFGCFTPPTGAGATVLRVLDRARALGAAPVVVLNGEIDDPQEAAALVRLIVRRYGLAFARSVYWEIGNAPAQWEHFGVPLSERLNEHIKCSPDQYAALVTSYAAALAPALGGIDPQGRWPRIVADEWIVNATDQSWTAIVTAVDTRYYAFDSPEIPASAADIVQGAASLDQRLQSLRANLAQYQQGQTLPLLVGQWNIDASAQPANPLYGSSAQAVFVAGLLLRLARGGVAMAAWAPPLYASAQAPFTASGARRPGFQIFTALRALGGAHILPMGQAVGLDDLAARLPDGRMAVLLVNARVRPVMLHLRVLGAAARAVTATTQTFASLGPSGATVPRTVTPTDIAVRIPALTVTLITLPR